MSARSVQLLLGVTAACLLTHSHRIQAAEDDFGDDDDYDDRDDDRDDDRQYTPGRKESDGGGLVDVRHNGFGEKHVGVHVPVFYKMNLDKDKYDGRKNLGIDVLKGLVKWPDYHCGTSDNDDAVDYCAVAVNGSTNDPTSVYARK